MPFSRGSSPPRNRTSISHIVYKSDLSKVYRVYYVGTSLVAQLVKNPPAMQETLVRFLHQEDPLEEGMATHSSILAWRIPMERGAWWCPVHRVA